MKTLPLPRAAPDGSARTQPAHADLLLGRYRLIEQVGSGGHGTVWIARDQERRQLVAVKRIAYRHDDPQERERAEREGRAAGRLDHPAIVRLYATGEDHEAHYLVTELVEGSSLAKLYRRGGVGDRDLMAIGGVLAGALEHAHERGVVHRDVKPQNVIVPARPSGVAAKLTDFGIARLAGENPLTATGDVIGTFEYMAPEQAHGRPAGPRADLYSLALTLYEGFAGSNPLRGETVAATALRLGAQIEPLASVRGDLPPALCAAIDRALAPAPAARGTLAQLRGALERALDQSEAPRRRRTAGRSQPRGADDAHPLALTRRARTLLAAASAGAVAGAVPSALLGAHTGIDAPLFAGACAAVAVALSPSVGWLLVTLAALAWVGAAGDPGTALVLAAALAPVPVLLAARPWLWSAPALGPLLGALGVAACAPVFAARLGARAPARAALGALSYWWLAVAEALSGRRLLLGAPAGVTGRASWQGSLPAAFQHALEPLCSDGRLLTAGVWALAAMLLPWLVRGPSLRWQAVGAAAWAVAMVAAQAALGGRFDLPRQPAPVAVGALAAALALVSANLRVRAHRRPNVA